MSSIFKTFATIGPLALVLGTAAQAADLPRAYPPSAPLPPPIQRAAPILVDEFASGWYLRGDVGYRINRLDSVENASALAPVIADDLDNSWLVGLGAGYKWQWFRADLTLDYGTKANYTGDTADMDADFTAKIDGVTGLLNVYGDLGTWFGLTPYIGAGVGMSYLRASQFEQHFVLPPSEAVATRGKTNFAWAWMAGLSYRVTSNYHIDLGYRHINLGDALTDTDDFGNQLTFKKLSSDEFRIGFRYLID
jgi:opacity protein-like surface antigen